MFQYFPSEFLFALIAVINRGQEPKPWPFSIKVSNQTYQEIKPNPKLETSSHNSTHVHVILFLHTAVPLIKSAN